MSSGTVKWFDAKKGYGFIEPQEGGKDVFVHVSALRSAGVDSLREGDKVTFEVAKNQKTGKTSAENIRVV